MRLTIIQCNITIWWYLIYSFGKKNCPNCIFVYGYVKNLLQENTSVCEHIRMFTVNKNNKKISHRICSGHSPLYTMWRNCVQFPWLQKYQPDGIYLHINSGGGVMDKSFSNSLLLFFKQQGKHKVSIISESWCHNLMT